MPKISQNGSRFEDSFGEALPRVVLHADRGENGASSGRRALGE